MPKLKRTSENQITKDNYDRGEEDCRFPEEKDPGTGMELASASVMKERRIVRVSRRKFNAPSAATPAKKPAVNAFANTELGAPSEASPSNNPFAKVQLSNSGTSTAPLSFSFGDMPESEPKPFSIGASSSSQPKRSSPTLPSSKPKSGNRQIGIINTNFFQLFTTQYDIGLGLCSDMSQYMKQYIEISERFELDEECSSDDDDVENSNDDNNSGVENNSQPTSTGTSSFSGFSFAATSSASPPSTGTTFSFTGGSTSAPASAPSFTFGSKPASTNSGSVSSNSNPISNEDDPTFNPDDGKLEIGKEENKDQEILYEVRARLLRSNDGAWKPFKPNTLKLYRNLVSGTKTMVIRNEVGKVLFNVAVGKGMKFQKKSQKTKRGEQWYVSFAAVEDKNEGIKSFMLNVAKENVDKLYEELEKMAA